MVINGNNTKFDLLLDIKRISKLHSTCLSARVLGLYNAYKNLQLFARTEIAHIVPAPEIKVICRLHDRIYTGYDFFDQ